jgi:hypothetical protein
LVPSQNRKAKSHHIQICEIILTETRGLMKNLTKIIEIPVKLIVKSFNFAANFFFFEFKQTYIMTKKKKKSIH